MQQRLVAIVLALTLATAASVSAMDIRSGFNGIRWKSKPSETEGLEQKDGKRNVAYFVKNPEDYTLAGLKVAGVVYGFYQEQFFAAFIDLTSQPDFDRLRSDLSATYGEPRAQLRVSQTIYIWQFQDIKIKLKKYLKENRFKLAYYFRPLSKRVNEADQEENAEKIIKFGFQ